MIIRFIILFLVTHLTACGFHLRGQGDTGAFPAQLRVIYVESAKPYGPLTQELQQMLKGMGARLTATAQEAPLKFVLVRDEVSQQTTGMNLTGQLNTYTLVYTVIYQIVDSSGRIVFGPHYATTSRSFTQNANQMLSSNYEYMQLEQDMRRDVVAQIMYQLGSKKAVQTLAAVGAALPK